MGGLDQLRVRLLGGLDVEGIDGRAIGTRKARTLVKLLALARGAAVSTDKVVDALWPGDDAPAKPAEQVGVLVSRLRSVLGPDRLPRTDAGWSLVVDWLDVAELEARVEEAAAWLAASSPGAARGAAGAALALVRGELLADEVDPVWAEAERAAVARAVARARLIGAEAALAAGDAGDAAAVAEGALDHDPYDEAALRVLMRAHAAVGRPASALAAYARVRERLAEDLGVDPVKDTEQLHTAILLGDPSLDGGAAAPAQPLTVVGRASELQTLDGLLGRAAAGRAVLAVVEGEAGIGKTTLVSAWSARQRAGALVLTGRCDELGRDLPLQPVLDGLQAHLRVLDTAAVDAMLGDAEPVLGSLLGRFSAARQPGPTTVTDPAAGQALLFASLLAVIERAAGDRPAVVIVEDVHLAGASTIEWLRFAVRRGRRLLVVATKRPEGANVGSGELVPVGPLDLRSVAELVGDDRAAELHARSGGHPLFLLELANAASDELPASVREAVAVRVDGMGAAATTLRTAAILGTEIDVDLLAGVLDKPVAILLEHLDAGVRALVLSERGAVLAFHHELVREALVADTTATRRAYVHREAARVLDDRPAHDPMEVAWHARAGGDVATAVAALMDAAATASSRYDVGLADSLLGDAIELADSVAARLARARVRIAPLRIDDAEADGLRALELGGGAEALEVAGWTAYYRRDYGIALQRAEAAVARTDDPGLRASCFTLSGRILHASGHLAEADERLTIAVDQAPVTVRGVAQAFLCCLRVHQGHVEEGNELADQALVDPTGLAHQFAAHHAYLFRAIALGMRGRPIEALAAGTVGAQFALAAGDSGSRFVPAQDNVRSWILRNLGLRGEADELSARAHEHAFSHRPAMNEMYHASQLDRIDAALLVGDDDAALLLFEEAADIKDWTGGQAWHHRQRYAVLGAALALRTDDAELAAERAQWGADDATMRGGLRYGSQARVLAARAQLRLGGRIDHEAADAALAGLDRCAALEAWRITAELAAETNVDRWWRDAERRAGALIANSGEHGETLRRRVATTFTALGR